MPEQELRRHPIRGGIWGIPTGLGLGLLAVNSQIFSLSITTLVVFAVIGIAIGAVWASFGPAKKPNDTPPLVAPEPIPEPVSVPSQETPPIAGTPVASAPLAGTPMAGEESSSDQTEQPPDSPLPPPPPPPEEPPPASPTAPV